jgi:hypothetical protein
LESDRIACLMLQAAATGVVNFRQLNLHDDRDRVRLELYLRGLVADNLRKCWLVKAQYYLATMQVPGLGSEDFTKTMDSAIEYLTRYEQSLQPWLKRNLQRDEQRSVQTLESLWEQEFGKLSDPETQKGVQDTVRRLKEMRQKKRHDRERLAQARKKLLERELTRKDAQLRRRARKMK